MVYNLLLLFFREFSVHLSDEGLNTSMISARVQDRIWLDCPTNRVRINVKFVLSRLHELHIKNAFMGIFLLCNLIYLMNYWLTVVCFWDFIEAHMTLTWKFAFLLFESECLTQLVTEISLLHCYFQF